MALQAIGFVLAAIAVASLRGMGGGLDVHPFADFGRGVLWRSNVRLIVACVGALLAVIGARPAANLATSGTFWLWSLDLLLVCVAVVASRAQLWAAFAWTDASWTRPTWRPSPRSLTTTGRLYVVVAVVSLAFSLGLAAAV